MFSSVFLNNYNVVIKNLYSALKACKIFILAARTEGRNPPRNPIATANSKDEIIIVGERAKLNASSENEPKLSVEIEKN